METQTDICRYQDLILPAKISRPPLRFGVVRRKQMDQVLEQSFLHRLTLVTAPAGFGKTTLVSNWLSERQYPVAWFSLTREDNQLPVFLSYLSAALKKGNAALGNYIEAYLNHKQAINLPALMVELRREMDQASPAMFLALDDYHLIENPKIHELVQFLVQNCTAWMDPETARTRGCHILLIGRNDPPFPVSRWRLHHELVEIRTDDLKFSAGEMETFLRDALQFEARTECVQRIAALSEGWVTGLQLAAMLLNANHLQNPGAEFVDLQGPHPLLADYLMEEVIENFPQEVQQFLLQTSILGHLTGDLCDRVRGQSGSQRILEWLAQANPFLISLDNQQGWYRYHQLFLDALVQRQSLLSAEQICEAHCRAAAWLEEKGFYQESLNHWLAAGNTDAAVEMIKKAAPSLLNTSQWLILQELFETFPKGEFSHYPWLCIYYAWSMAVFEKDTIYLWLDQAMELAQWDRGEKRYGHQEIMEMQGNIDTIRALTEARYGENEKAITDANRALDLLPASAWNVKGLALIALARVYMKLGELDEAMRMLSRSETYSIKGGNLSGVLEVYYLMGGIFQTRGKLRAAHQYFEKAISILRERPDHEFYYGYLSAASQGLIELEWNHLNLAEECIQKSPSRKNILCVLDQLVYSISLIKLKLRQGKAAAVDEMIEEVETYLENPVVTRQDHSELVAVLLDYYLQRRNPSIARQFLEEYHIQSIRVDDNIREAELLSLARYYEKTCEWKKLNDLAERLSPLLEERKHIDAFIQVQTLNAIACFKLGNLPLAAQALTQALNRGAREGYLWTYVQYGAPILQVIALLANNTAADEGAAFDIAYWGEITAVISKRLAQETGQKKQNHIEKQTLLHHLERMEEPLTGQERLVLQYLAGGNDNKGIAQELKVSNNTVKTHLANIYSKLGVHSRIEALNRAKALGLL